MVNMRDSYPPTLLYNHLIRSTHPEKLGDNQTERHLRDDEELVLGGLYKELSGHLCKMVKALHPDSMEYRWGFRFIGDNHVFYRKTGSTTEDGSSGMNDIAMVVEERKE